MTATKTTNAETIGRIIASRVRGRPDILGLWVRQHDEMAELWMIVDAEDLEAEQRLRRVDEDLFEEFPNVDWELRVYDVKLMGTDDTGGFVPRDAMRIET